jgi:hypothetical protein
MRVPKDGGIVAEGRLGCSKNDCGSGSVEISATEEVAAGAADELAAAVFEARGAGGAEDGVVFGCGEGALLWGRLRVRFGSAELHSARVAQFVNFSTPVSALGASNGVRFDK